MDNDDDMAVCRDIFEICRALNLPILQMKTEKASLEDIFIELTSSEAESQNAEDGNPAEGTDAAEPDAADPDEAAEKEAKGGNE